MPKLFARYRPSYDHNRYYQHYVLNYLQAEELRSGSALVKALRNGARVVHKKGLKKKYPLTKRFLYDFSVSHPEVLAHYRADLAAARKSGQTDAEDIGDDPQVARALADALVTIPPGAVSASIYHSWITGALEFLFFPSLVNPQKEAEIHNGRKRIDIVMDNNASEGLFSQLPTLRQIPCAFIAIECKNYSTEIANPELDQLSGRFGTLLGKVGLLCCRRFEDRERFIARCQDTLRDGRGLVLPLDDATLLRMLNHVATGARNRVDAELRDIANEVWLP